MGIQLKHAISTSFLALAAALVPFSAQAQDASSENVPVLDALDNIFFNHSGTFFEGRTTGAMMSLMFGTGGFPEQQVEWDADAIHRASVDLLILQTQTDPTIRVPDLPNPFTYSLLTSPGYQVTGTPAFGSQFIYEMAPLP